MQRSHFRPPHPAAGGFRTPPPELDRTGGGRFPSRSCGFPNGPYGARFGSYGGSPVTHTPPREFGGNRSGGSGMYNAKSPGHTPHRPSGSPASRLSPYQSPGAPHGGYQSPRAPHGGYQSPGAPHGGYQSPRAPHGGYQSPGAPHGGYQSPGAPHGGYQSPGAPHGGYQSPGAPHGGYQSPGAPHGGYQGFPRTSTPYSRDRSTSDMEKYYKASMLLDPWANLQPVSVTQTPSKYSSQQATHTGRTGRYYNRNYTA